MNLRCYAHMVLKTNPGSVAIVQSDASGKRPHFKRIFLCLEACRMGFVQACRPVIGLDGCHLKAHMVVYCWQQ